MRSTAQRHMLHIAQYLIGAYHQRVHDGVLHEAGEVLKALAWLEQDAERRWPGAAYRHMPATSAASLERDLQRLYVQREYNAMLDAQREERFEDARLHRAAWQRLGAQLEAM